MLTLYLVLFLKGEVVDFSHLGVIDSQIVVLGKDGVLGHLIGTTIDVKTCRCVYAFFRVCSGAYFDVLKMRFFTSQVVRQTIFVGLRLLR